MTISIIAAFILGETGKIASDSDFVYYNSKCKIGDLPSNLDGTVFLADEHARYIEEYTDYNCEAICLEFDRIDADKVFVSNWFLAIMIKKELSNILILLRFVYVTMV